MASIVNTPGSYAADYREDKALIYNDYVRGCLLEVGLLPDEIDGIFEDNARLCAEIAGEQARQERERRNSLDASRERAREGMRRLRARRAGLPEYLAADGTMKPVPADPDGSDDWQA